MTSLSEQLQSLARRYRVAELYAFGSRAMEIAGRVRGQAVAPEYPDSDVDIGVWPEPGQHLTAQDRVHLTKEIAIALVQVGVLDQSQGRLLRNLAGYRNRLVYFYDEVSDRELYEFCTGRLGDVDTLLTALMEWMRNHPEMIDQAI